MNIAKEVIIGGVTYTINLEEAKRLNLIAPKVVTRPVTIGDVPVGCVFRWGSPERIFGVIDFVLTQRGEPRSNCTNITDSKHYKYGRTGLSFSNVETVQGYFDDNGNFISEIKIKQPEPPAKEKLYGFYSRKAAAIYGNIYYLTPDGRTVTVTCVDRDKEYDGHKWPDRVCVGEVTKFISRDKNSFDI